MAVFQHDGITFHYRTIGDGPPLVFSHGLAWDMERSLELLDSVPGHQLIVWDVRAHGRTTPIGPEEGLSFRTFATDLSALLDHLKIDRAVIGGISMGAAISTQFAVENPERLLGLILVQPAWLPDRRSMNLGCFVKIADLLERFGVEEGANQLKLDPEFRNILKSAPHAADSLLGQFQKPLAARRSARLRCLPLDRPVGSWDRIGQLRLPTLVIGTEDDPIHPLEHTQRWASHIPQARSEKATPKSIDNELYVYGIRDKIQQFLRTLPATCLPCVEAAKEGKE